MARLLLIRAALIGGWSRWRSTSATRGFGARWPGGSSVLPTLEPHAALYDAYAAQKLGATIDEFEATSV